MLERLEKIVLSVAFVVYFSKIVMKGADVSDGILMSVIVICLILQEYLNKIKINREKFIEENNRVIQEMKKDIEELKKLQEMNKVEMEKFLDFMNSQKIRIIK